MNQGMFNDMMAAFDALTQRLDRLIALMEAQRTQPVGWVSDNTVELSSRHDPVQVTMGMPPLLEPTLVDQAIQRIGMHTSGGTKPKTTKATKK